MGLAFRRLRMRCLSCLATALFLATSGAVPAQTDNRYVDVSLALGVDISYSMNDDEQRLQRLGYIEALTSKTVLDGIAAGPNGRIAITYYEWAGDFERRTIVPWSVIDGPDSAARFVAALQAMPPRRASRTSISGGIDYGVSLLEASPYRAIRKVIDISGDGPNNNGRPVAEARADALARGITINGLPIIFSRSFNSSFDIDNLDTYYADCVIGGPGAFMVAISSRPQFAEATRQKLIREIAAPADQPRIIPAATTEKTDCLIGEKLWQKRFEQ